MKISRPLFLSALIALGVSTLPLAQAPVEAQAKQPAAAKKGEKRRGGQRQGQRRDQLEAMAKRLNLMESQKARIKPILEQSRQQSQKVRDDKSMTPEQKRKKRREIQVNTQKKIEPILTAEQRKTMAEQRKKMMEQRAQRQGAAKQ